MMPLEYWLLLIAFIGIVIALAKPMGLYLAGLMDGSAWVVKAGLKFEHRTLEVCPKYAAHGFSLHSPATIFDESHTCQTANSDSKP